MKTTIKIPDEQVAQLINGIMQNYPEAGSGNSLRCTNWNYELNIYEFSDDDSGKFHIVTFSHLVDIVPLMFTDKWPKGCTKLPTVLTEQSVDDWLCQADATDFDSFVQLAVFGEVVYG